MRVGRRNGMQLAEQRPVCPAVPPAARPRRSDHPAAAVFGVEPDLVDLFQRPSGDHSFFEDLAEGPFEALLGVRRGFLASAGVGNFHGDGGVLAASG